MPDRVKPSFVIFVIKALWCSALSVREECPDFKNYKWLLNPVCHRMLYSCTHMATVGVKGLRTQIAVAAICCLLRHNFVYCWETFEAWSQWRVVLVRLFHMLLAQLSCICLYILCLYYVLLTGIHFNANAASDWEVECFEGHRQRSVSTAWGSLVHCLLIKQQLMSVNVMLVLRHVKQVANINSSVTD